MASTVASRKAKGRKAQQQVVEQLKATFGFADTDVKSIPGGVQGVDIWLSAEALKQFPFSIEVKCQEALNIWSALEQASTNLLPNTKPLLMFKRNRTDMFVALSLNDFLELVKK